MIINDGPVIAVTPHGDGTGTRVTYEGGEVVADETIAVELPEVVAPDEFVSKAELVAAIESAPAGGLRAALLAALT